MLTSRTRGLAVPGRIWIGNAGLVVPDESNVVCQEVTHINKCPGADSVHQLHWDGLARWQGTNSNWLWQADSRMG